MWQTIRAQPARHARLRSRVLLRAGVGLLLAALGLPGKALAAGTQPGSAPAAVEADSRQLPPAAVTNGREYLRQLHRARKLRNARLPVDAHQHADRYRPLVERYARRYALPPELIFALIERESRFDPQARSTANAIGLMQIIPDQAGRAAGRYAQPQRELPTADDLLDPELNIHYGTAYVRLLMDRYFHDVPGDELRLAVVLAAYNWGPGNIRQVLEQAGMPATVAEFEALLAGHAPAETQAFVRGISRRMPAYL
jgi:membrane-bound lytic murein transglycosylase C